MIVCNHRGFLVIQTKFDDKFFLIQKFRGVDNTSLFFNNPVDFMESGLMHKGKCDYWHIDIPFAINTDEAVPAFVNGEFIGANHGCCCAVELYAPAHGKTLADIGSLWQDEAGVKFTLLQVYNEDYLLFVSENQGLSTLDYSFVKKIKGKLFPLDDFSEQTIVFPIEQKLVDLRRSIRNKNKRVVAFVNGQERTFRGKIECDCVEIREEYDIINPATVAVSLRKLRPDNGYDYQPDLSDYGEAMLSCSLVYRITEDGIIFTIFDYKKLADVKFSRFLGTMYQEKLDVYNGGIWRYFPKILPFETPEGKFDFSTPLNITNDIFPNNTMLTREFFEDNGSPCERVVDYFRDTNGRDKLCFACGFLPVYDGKPEIRKKQVENVLHLKYTRKYYPTFTDGNLQKIKGVSYKKYFIPQQDKGSFYIVPFNGEKYIYVDIFVKNTITFPFVGKIKILEKSNGVKYHIKDNTVSVIAEKGFAVFVERSS